MPQYILPIDSADTARDFNSLDDFTQGYITALFWTEEDALAEEGCANAGPGDMRPSFLAACLADCARFQAENADDLEAVSERRDAEDCGHDFWLTRCGHGTGFWDRGLGDVGLDSDGRVCS